MNECKSKVQVSTLFPLTSRITKHSVLFCLICFWKSVSPKTDPNWQGTHWVTLRLEGRDSCGVGSRVHLCLMRLLVSPWEARAGTQASRCSGWGGGGDTNASPTLPAQMRMFQRFLSEKLKNRWQNKDSLQMRSRCFVCMHITLFVCATDIYATSSG